MIEKALVSLLKDVAGVSEGTIFPLVAPARAAYPFVVYQLISEGDRWPTLEGPSGFGHPRFQLTTWALTFREAKELSDQIRQAIDGYDGTQAGVRLSVQKDNETHLTDQDRSKQDTTIFGVATDYIIIHEE